MKAPGTRHREAGSPDTPGHAESGVQSAAGAARLPWWLPILLLLCLTAYLIPVLQSGYASDDLSYAVTTKGFNALHGSPSLLELVDRHVEDSILRGRYLPFATLLIQTVYTHHEHVLVYKAYLLVMTVLCALLFYLLARALCGYALPAALALLVLPALLQFRPHFHEALISLHGLLQWLALFTFGSLLCLQRYLERRSMTALAGSLVLYVMALLTYEFAILFVPLHAVLIWRHDRDMRLTVRRLLPYLACLVFVLVLFFLARQLRPAQSYEYTGTKPNLEPGRVGMTYLLQLYATLPLSSWHDNPFGSLYLLKQYQLDAVLFGVLFFVTARVLVRHTGDRCLSDRTGAPALVGLFLVLLPAVPVAVSTKYQNELRPGIGYTPVFLQCFGAALLIAWSVSGLAQHLRTARGRRVLLAGLCGAVLLLGLVHYPLNKARVLSHKAMHRANDTLRRAARAGLFHDLPPHSLLLFRSWHAWSPSSYRYLLYRTTRTPLECRAWPRHAASVPADTWVVASPAVSAAERNVRLGKVAFLTRDEAGPHGVRAYVSEFRHFRLRTKGADLVYGETRDGYRVKRFEEGHLAEDGAYEWNRVDFGDDPVAFDSLAVF